MSLQQEPQQEPQQEVAARVIQRAWRRHVFTEVFRYIKQLVRRCDQRDPQSVLRSVNPREAELLDAAAGVFVRFRLGGVAFPPSIYYKIFTHRPIADVCASSPRDYTQPGLKAPVPRQTHNGWPLMQEDRSAWYQRTENNSWRLFCSKVLPVAEPTEIGADKKMDFHYSRLQRQQDVDRWRRRRKVEWLRQMYNRGRLQTQPLQGHLAPRVGDPAQAAMDATEERGGDEVEDWELDELLAWTTTFSFEGYMQQWRRLACSHSSQLSTGRFMSCRCHCLRIIHILPGQRRLSWLLRLMRIIRQQRINHHVLTEQ